MLSPDTERDTSVWLTSEYATTPLAVWRWRLPPADVSQVAAVMIIQAWFEDEYSDFFQILYRTRYIYAIKSHYHPSPSQGTFIMTVLPSSPEPVTGLRALVLALKRLQHLPDLETARKRALIRYYEAPTWLNDIWLALG